MTYQQVVLKETILIIVNMKSVMVSIESKSLQLLEDYCKRVQ